ncbi:MAG TPA: DUF4347 domain-containing protein [Oculatellaceae cyanobacterium]|jgi:VCBS repeat-containing protein
MTTTPNTSTTSSIVIIDPTVADYKQLIAGLQGNPEVFILDSQLDGISQITSILSNHSQVSNLKIISHGSDGNLYLGNTSINQLNIDTYKSQLNQWSGSLTDDADILLYGCNVASSSNGVKFIQTLSELTGADVAASNDLTGNASLGGDWDLEVTTGVIETPTAFDAEVENNYQNVLASFSEDTSLTLPGVEQSSVTWGDYNNDGLLDFLLTGLNGSTRISKLYQNTGSGFSEDTTVTLPGVFNSSVAWGDYNNDGLLDFLLAGVAGSGRISKLYQNTGSGFSEDTTVSLPGVVQGDVAWGDYNNDGLLDILLTGYNAPNSDGISKLYKNTGSGFSEDTSVTLPGVGDSSVAWGDYNNDGLLDFLLTGYSGFTLISKLYKNTGSGFSEDTSVSLPGVQNGSVAWGDYNNDGKLDFLLTGRTTSGFISKLYKNTGSGFSQDTSVSLPGVQLSSVAWGDYNNDGLLDFLLTGNTGGISLISKLYYNTGSGFSEDTSVSLPGFQQSSVAWGDYNNDRKLDFLLTGQSAAGRISKLYTNTGDTANTAPSAPSNLNATINGTLVNLSWSPGTDNETPATGLDYNIMIGTTEGSNDILSSMSDSSGNRLIPSLGNVNANLSWTFNHNLPSGHKYYWGVQSIDTAFAGSSFATGEFIINNAAVANPDSYTTAEDTTLTITAPGILSNDNDADGNSFTAQLVTGPSHGSLSLNPDGSFTYIPDQNYNGSDSFTYFANDNLINGQPATVTLTVNSVNDAPAANNDNFSVNEDTTLTVAISDLVANDTDIEGDTLTFDSFTQPSHGTLTLDNGNLIYQPFANYNGTDSFTYTANDGTVDSNSAIVNLTVNAVDDTAFYVTNTNDSGIGSLRQAILDANADPGIEDIIFNLNTSQPQTINLLTVLPDIGDTGVNFKGLGADNLIVTRSTQATSDFRIFKVNAGAIVSIEGMTISNGKATGNFPTGAGGGVYNDGILSVSNSKFSNNLAAFGGAIFNSSNGKLTSITSSTISNNQATFGGGIFNQAGSIINSITSSTISDNSASQLGGGILNQVSGEIKDITNSTIGNNIATIAGAGIFNQTNGKIKITSSTISANTTNHGGGIYNEEGTITAKNTIIAGNTANFVPDFVSTANSTFISGGHNLIGTATTGTIASDIITSDTKLGTLQNNGGTTQTIALLPGSPAINAGDDSNAPTTDQRGQTRIFDGKIDIGAYESRIAIVTGTTKNENISSNITNADVIEFRAQAGSDVIKATALSDYIDGGTGKDQVTYATSTAAININLATNTASGGHANNDTLIGIEGIIGSSYNDVITGSTENGTFNGGAGADTINGGGGTDSTSYTTSTAAVNVNLNTGINRGGDAEFDILTSIENLIGSKFHDTLTGSNNSQVIYGGSGNDSITGGTSQDLLYGDNGNDTLLGAAGQDILTGGAGADVLDGGEGKDQINYATSRNGVNINLFDSTATGGDATGDSFLNIEDIAGSAYKDTLTGDDGSNSLVGRNGNDVLKARGGDDILVGDLGADSLDGGDGIDTVTYFSSNDAINVNLATATYSGGYAQGDSLSQIENLIGSSFNDELGGNSSNNQLEGGSGNDTLSGYNPSSFGVGEIDTLIGGVGSDRFVVGSNYNDGDNTTKGINDYVLIKDFKVGQDVVQLANNLTYFLGSSPSGVVGGTSIFIDNDGTSGLTTQDELIGVLQGVNLGKGLISNNTQGFNFV